MSEDKKKKEALEITEEENVEKQFEFGLNEDKREEAEESGHELPSEQRDVSTDAENVEYEENTDDEVEVPKEGEHPHPEDVRDIATGAKTVEYEDNN